MQETARALANIDVLVSLAEVAFKYNYVCPELNNRSEIKIYDGRHPVVERLLEREIFVPNNTTLNNNDERMIILQDRIWQVNRPICAKLLCWS